MARFKNISEPRLAARTDLGPGDAVNLMCTNIFISDFTEAALLYEPYLLNTFL